MAKKRKMSLATKLDFFVPSVPNYISMTHEDKDDGVSISVGCFSDEELEAIGKEWLQDLKNNAMRMRKENGEE